MWTLQEEEPGWKEWVLGALGDCTLFLALALLPGFQKEQVPWATPSTRMLCLTSGQSNKAVRNF